MNAPAAGCWTLDTQIVQNPYIAYGCMPMKIAVAPQDPSDTASVNAVTEFMAWVNAAYPYQGKVIILDKYKSFINGCL